MATTTNKSILMHKIYESGDIDNLYPQTLAGNVLLSTGSTTTLSTYVDKVDGISEGATKVASSSTNGCISIDGTSTTVYTHPSYTARTNVLRVTTDATGHITSGDVVVSSGTVAWSTASSRANLTTGETLATAFGKLAKWYTDFGSLAWLSSVSTSYLDDTLQTTIGKVLTTDNITTSTSVTETGYVPDATVIASMQSSIDTLNSKASEHVNYNQISSVTGGIRFYHDYDNGVYSDLRLSGSAGSYDLGIVYNDGEDNYTYRTLMSCDGDFIARKADVSHASTSTTYGAGTSSNYGHVKLSDNYTSSAGAASASVGASSLAVYNAYNKITSDSSPTTLYGSSITLGYNRGSSSRGWLDLYYNSTTLGGSIFANDDSLDSNYGDGVVVRSSYYLSLAATTSSGRINVSQYDLAGTYRTNKKLMSGWYTTLTPTALNSFTVSSSSYVYVVSDYILIFYIILTAPTISSSAWINMCTIPSTYGTWNGFYVPAHVNIGTSPYLRDGRLSSNTLMAYLTSSDSSKKLYICGTSCLNSEP